MESSGPNLRSLADFLQRAMRRYQSQASEPTRSLDGLVQAGHSSEERPFLPRPSVPAMDIAWQNALQTYQEGRTVMCIVTGWNRGGLLVRWNELQGFVPASQLKEMPVFEEESSRDEILARWVGEELGVKVIEIDRSRNRLVFSERATIWGPKDGDHLLAEVTPGETRDGRVSNLCDFGAFVDLGGIDGLVHISELSWGRVTHPRELLTLGQFVRVYVISVDKENRRVALSLKRLRPDPWSVVDHKYAPGAIVSATITNVVDFGAFARIEDGLEGLIHVSELSPASVTYPSEVVQPGDQVQVRVLRVDSINHRLGLSLKLDGDEPPMDAPWEGFTSQEA
jgi:small subunit ribosomal protein S1